MRIAINLASRPFVELRPLFARLRLTMAALGVLALALGIGLHFLSRTTAEEGARMDSLVSQTQTYQDQRAQNEARMRQPQNLGVLERAQFLNALFANKSFSWTAVMMDLERVLPAGVQVTSIDPVISKQGEVMIRLRVSGDRDRAVQLIRNLEHSQRFVGPRLAGESALTREKAAALNGGTVQNASAAAGGNPAGNGVEFEIFSGYNPLPDLKVGSGKAPAADVKRSGSGEPSPRAFVQAPPQAFVQGQPQPGQAKGAR